MKTRYLMVMSIMLALALAGCETIDEARYANVDCKDLKQLMATDNLASLSQPQDTGLYRSANERQDRESRGLFDGLDNDRKRQAELRAAYRNNCRS